jgi:hypothetical protein|tara:strand:- start:1224 stop:1448 length:225 start_codon:yes stop_codon:yes gene_type:complete
MPEQTKLKFSIRQDGLVSEEVFGTVGNECENLTRTIEEKLGEVTYIEHKPEYYQQENVTLQHNQDQNQEQTTTT